MSCDIVRQSGDVTKRSNAAVPYKRCNWLKTCVVGDSLVGAVSNNMTIQSK